MIYFLGFDHNFLYTLVMHFRFTNF